MKRADERESEVAQLRCSAHTLRLEGDYVGAQVFERELERLLASSAPFKAATAIRKPLKTVGQRSRAFLAKSVQPSYKGGSGE